MKNHSPGFLALVHAAKALIQECTAAEVAARVRAGEQPLIVDVREQSEFAAGHIAGAIHLGKGILERDIEARIPDHTAEIILYCGGGFRSALAADALQRMGYTRVASMDGGWRGWRAADGPTTG